MRYLSAPRSDPNRRVMEFYFESSGNGLLRPAELLMDTRDSSESRAGYVFAHQRLRRYAIASYSSRTASPQRPRVASSVHPHKAHRNFITVATSMRKCRCVCLVGLNQLTTAPLSCNRLFASKGEREGWVAKRGATSRQAFRVQPPAAMKRPHPLPPPHLYTEKNSSPRCALVARESVSDRGVAR